MGIDFNKFVNAFKEQVTTKGTDKTSSTKGEASAQVEKESFSELLANTFGCVFSEDNLKQIQDEFLDIAESLNIESSNEEEYGIMPEAEFKNLMSDLYADLAGADTQDERNMVQAKIEQVKKQQQAGVDAMYEDRYGIMPEAEAKNKLTNFYEQLSMADTPEQREKIQAEINAFQRQQQAGIDAFYKDRYGIMPEAEFKNLMSDLYADLAGADTQDERNMVQAKIEQVKKQQQAGVDAMYEDRYGIMPEAEAKNKLTNFYEQLSMADTPEQREKIQAEINAFQRQQQARIDAMYEDLNNADAKSQRVAIEAKIQKLEMEYKAELDSM